MFKGTVEFAARIKGNGLTFPRCAFSPTEAGVDKVEIEGPSGEEIRSIVYVTCVAFPADGMVLAVKVNTAALNRIAFIHNIAIENARSTGEQFSPLQTQGGDHVLVAATGHYYLVGSAPNLTVGLSAEQIKRELEQATPPGERNYGLFRSARQSVGPVEEFMHLYNILLMLFNDRQADVDNFIVGEDHAVLQTPSPRTLGLMETDYTRLRNELAHPRVGVDLDDTKAQMASRLGALITLVKRAIEQRT
jgi:hypothetical protein